MDKQYLTGAGTNSKPMIVISSPQLYYYALSYILVKHAIVAALSVCPQASSRDGLHPLIQASCLYYPEIASYLVA